MKCHTAQRQGCLHRGTSERTSFKSREDLSTQQRTRTEKETFQERGEVKLWRWKVWDISTHQLGQAVIAEKYHMKMLKANGDRLLSDTGDCALQENKSETSRTLT